MDQGFPPEARLHSRRDYGRVFHRQQKAAGRNAVVLVAPRGKRGPDPAARGRLGVMVSTKVAKKAVRRHQLKRWVRELFRREWAPELRGYDVVVLLRADPREGHAPFDRELRRLLEHALRAEAKPGTSPPSRRGRRREGGRQP